MISNRIVQKNRVASSGGTTTNRWGWGTNEYQLIKQSTTSPYMSPVMSDQSGSTTTWTKISHGSQFSCGIDSNSRLFCWGINTWGQVGNGNTFSQSTPVQIGSGSWRDVSCGTNHVLAIDSSGKLFSWGRNNRGQLGDSTYNNRSSPVQVNSYNWMIISAGHSFSMGITDYYNNSTMGYLYGWGFNDFGQLGDGSTTTRTSPVKITSVNSPYRWTNVVAGYQHCVASRWNVQYIFTWGRNNYGQLGDGGSVDRNYPSSVPISAYPFKLEAAGFNSAFITTSYRLYVFGNNTYGQIGNNTTVTQYAPQGGFTNYYLDIQMVADASNKVSTFAITNSYKLYSWGFGGNFVLGNNSNTSISVPSQVGTSNDWVKLSITGGINSTNMFALK